MEQRNLELARVCTELGFCNQVEAQRALGLASQLSDLGRADDVLSILVDQGTLQAPQAAQVRRSVDLVSELATATFDDAELAEARVRKADWEPDSWLADPTTTFNRADLESARKSEKPEVTAEFSDADLQAAMRGQSDTTIGRMASLDAAALEMFEQEQFGRDLAGMVLGGCRLEREIGRGAMAVVYESTQIALDRKVAVKVLMPSAVRRGSSHDQLVREARALARTEHANIVQVQDVGAENGLSFIVMQLLEGDNLAQFLARTGKVQWESACRLTLGIAEGLAVAHGQGVVHRDIKPANVLITKDGTPKIADFGLASQFSESNAGGDQIMGTPAYMSPEQIDGRSVDGRSDLYSLGCTLYEILSGRKPFAGSHALEVMLKQTIEVAVPVHTIEPSVPESVSRVVQKCMAKNPESRYATAGDLAEDLKNVLGGGKPQIVDEIEDVMSRMERLIAAAPQPGSRFQPAPIVVAALVVIAATVIGVTIALPAVHAEAPPVLPMSAVKAGDSRSERAIAALSQALQFARDNRDDWDAVEARYVGIHEEFGDLLGDAWERSHVRAVSEFERAREEHLTEVLRAATPQLRSDDPVSAVRTLLTFPAYERRGDQAARWNTAYADALQRVRETTGMAFVPMSGGDAGAAAGFLIDLTEVSNKEYARFVAETAARAPTYWPEGAPAQGTEDRPVVGITAAEAQAYAEWKGGRLPTAAEWERAAAGDDHRPYPWGQEFDAKRCASRGEGVDALVPVRAFEEGRSPSGLFNMAGNAMEWTADTSDNPVDGVGRIVRGGSVRSHPGACTTSFRYAVDPATDDPKLLIGFRCVRDVR